MTRCKYCHTQLQAGTGVDSLLYGPLCYTCAAIPGLTERMAVQEVERIMRGDRG